MATRAQEEHYSAVKALLPSAVYSKTAHVVTITGKEIKKSGLIAVCTAGTADIPVAEEAALTAEAFGCNVERIFDIGIAGIHRLFDRLESIRKANTVIAVAGMKGALAGVIGGLVDRPVIAVPTSVGYGANFGGLSALLRCSTPVRQASALSILITVLAQATLQPRSTALIIMKRV